MLSAHVIAGACVGDGELAVAVRTVHSGVFSLMIVSACSNVLKPCLDRILRIRSSERCVSVYAVKTLWKASTCSGSFGLITSSDMAVVGLGS